MSDEEYLNEYDYPGYNSVADTLLADLDADMWLGQECKEEA